MNVVNMEKTEWIKYDWFATWTEHPSFEILLDFILDEK